jgi:formylglycine-generating enzyme required for sulfatase activity
VALLGIAGCRQIVGIVDRSEEFAAPPNDSGTATETSTASDAGEQEFTPCTGLGCVPTSCAALLPDGGEAGARRLHECGPNGNEDCCATITIDGGTVYLPPNLDTPTPVGPYRLDKFEVTVGRMRAFVESGFGIQRRPPAENAGSHPRIPWSGWDPKWDGLLNANTADLVRNLLFCTDERHGTWEDEDLRVPITCANWYEAFAFCIWDGGRLPTEAEWQFAATGGDKDRRYPFAKEVPDGGVEGYANFCRYPADSDGGTIASFKCADQPTVMPVGRFSPKGDGPFGHAELAGNAFEYVLDWYFPSPEPCIAECAQVSQVGSGTSQRVLRGSSFRYSSYQLQNDVRDGFHPENRSMSFGFRCARYL